MNIDQPIPFTVVNVPDDASGVIDAGTAPVETVTTADLERVAVEAFEAMMMARTFQDWGMASDSEVLETTSVWIEAFAAYCTAITEDGTENQGGDLR